MTLTDNQYNRLTFYAAYMADLAYDVVKEEQLGNPCDKKLCILTYGVMLIERIKCSVNFTQDELNSMLDKLEELYIGPYNDKELDIQDDAVISI